MYWPSVEHMLRMAAADLIIFKNDEAGPLVLDPVAKLPKGTLTVPLVESRLCAQSTWRSEHVETLSRWYPGRLLYLGEPMTLISRFSRDFVTGAEICLEWLLTLLPARKGRKTVFTADCEHIPVPRLAASYGCSVFLVAPVASDLLQSGASAKVADLSYVSRSGPLPSYSGNRTQEDYSILDLLASVGEVGTRQYLAQSFVWNPV